MKALVWPLTALASAALVLIIYLSDGFKTNTEIVAIQNNKAINPPVRMEEEVTPINRPDASITLLREDLQDALDRIIYLENEVLQLRTRVAEFEEHTQSNTTFNSQPAIQLNQKNANNSHVTSISDFDKTLLLNAGVNDAIATDIMLRYNNAEMEKLEVRDDAIRGGYLNKPKYYRELREVEDPFETLRNDIGDTAYDQVLYTTGRNNRVSVDSIIPGSPAELAGLSENDIIVDYADKPVFNPMELKNSTSKGQRHEYVNVTVLRDGDPLTLMVPRGPLGIRLGTERMKPNSTNN